MHNFKELIVWQKARELTKELYVASESFPKSETFGLALQMRRAVVSIPSNIAEGAGRTTDADFCRFLDIANGSAFELESQMYLASDLGYVSNEVLNQLLAKIQNVQCLIYNFRKSLLNKKS